MVYRLFHHNQEVHSYESRLLDGDLDKVSVIDTSQDQGSKIRPFSLYAGRAVDPAHLPRRVEIEGPQRPLTDYYQGSGLWVVDRFKNVVEDLEPGVHQFEPFDLYWKNGVFADRRYWFFPGNRLDSVDREKTTKTFRNIWKSAGDGVFVFSRSKIGSHHIWIDMFMSSIVGALVSNKMHDALVSADLTGLGFEEFDETD